MSQAFVIALREGIEAFLIIAITIAYLRKSGRHELLSPVYWGVAVSVVTSVVAGYLFSLAANRALWEGILATVAAVLVASLVIHMWRIGRTLKLKIHSSLDTAASRPSTFAAWMGIFGFTVLMITREGMETALLLGTLMFQMKAFGVLLGAVTGLVSAGCVAWLWSRYGHRVDLRRFFQVTAIFLLIFSGQLLIYAAHEMAEADIFPGSTAFHDATEAYGPDGIYGKWLTFALVIVPLAWLALSQIQGLKKRGNSALPGPPEITSGSRQPGFSRGTSA